MCGLDRRHCERKNLREESDPRRKTPSRARYGAWTHRTERPLGLLPAPWPCPTWPWRSADGGEGVDPARGERARGEPDPGA